LQSLATYSHSRVVGCRAATTCAPIPTVANPRANALGVTRWYNVVSGY